MSIRIDRGLEASGRLACLEPVTRFRDDSLHSAYQHTPGSFWFLPVKKGTAQTTAFWGLIQATSAAVGRSDAAFAQRFFATPGLGTVVATLLAHGVHHLPPGVGLPYLGTVVSSACFGMIGVALWALTRNTIGAIVAAIAWTLFVEQVILAAIVPGIEKWLPTGAAIGLTNAPGPGPGHSLPAAVAGVVLAGDAIVMLLAAKPHHHPARCRLTQATAYADGSTAMASIEISRLRGSATLARAEPAGGGSGMKRA